MSLTITISCTSSTKGRGSDDKRKLSELYVEMGVRYMEFGKLNIALEKLERALDIDDSNANAHDSIGVFYEKIQNYEEAEEHFQEALDLEPENPAIMNNYGGFLCRKGRDDEAMVYLLKSAKLPLNERPWYAWANAGTCEFKRGNSQIAEDYLRKSLLSNPAYPPALVTLAEIHYEKPEYMKSRAFLERYLSQSNSITPKALIIGFLVEQALNQPVKAEEYKARLLTQFPLSDEADKVRQMDKLVPKSKPISSRLIDPSSNATMFNKPALEPESAAEEKILTSPEMLPVKAIEPVSELEAATKTGVETELVSEPKSDIESINNQPEKVFQLESGQESTEP